MKLLIDLRAEARKKKDFATADRIRNALTEIGVDAGGSARRHGVEREVRRTSECGRSSDDDGTAQCPGRPCTSPIQPCLSASSASIPA